MKNILFAAHDPGGANVILSVINLFSNTNEYFLNLVLLGPARNNIILTNNNIKYFDLPSYNEPNFPNEKSVVEEDIQNLFKNKDFNLVFTATSYNSNLEKLIIKYSKKNSIPVVSIIDYWSNYRFRFILDDVSYFPDVIFVSDNLMKQDLRDLNITSKVVLSGNPHLYDLSSKYLCYRNNERGSSNKIRFFSENIKHYFPHREKNEFVIVENIIKVFLTSDLDIRFLVRPHPMESIQPWNDFIDNLKAKYKLEHVEIFIDKSNFDEVLKDDFIAIGISSMALIETSICGIHSYSYQIGLKEKEFLFLPFEEYNIQRITTDENLFDVFKKKEIKPLVSIQKQDCLKIIEKTIKEIIK